MCKVSRRRQRRELQQKSPTALPDGPMSLFVFNFYESALENAKRVRASFRKDARLLREGGGGGRSAHIRPPQQRRVLARVVPGFFHRLLLEAPGGAVVVVYPQGRGVSPAHVKSRRLQGKGGGFVCRNGTHGPSTGQGGREGHRQWEEGGGRGGGTLFFDAATHFRCWRMLISAAGDAGGSQTVNRVSSTVCLVCFFCVQRVVRQKKTEENKNKTRRQKILS